MSLVSRRRPRTSSYQGLRLGVDEYLALPDDGNKYQLIDGVVVMSPSPTPKHQLVAGMIFGELYAHVTRRKLGLVLYETDVAVGRGASGKDLVYRPEIVFIAASRVAQIKDRIRIPPDLVVEVISPDSRSLDTETKFVDYQAAGVGEYWLIDPDENRMTFFRLENGRYVEASATAEHYESLILPGLRLELAPIRAAFTAL